MAATMTKALSRSLGAGGGLIYKTIYGEVFRINIVKITLPPLEKGYLIARPNRFLAQVKLGDVEILAHVADPGRLEELLYPGAAVYVAKAGNPNRKTSFDLKLVQGENGFVSVDSGVPNRLAKKALAAEIWPLFHGYTDIKAEPRHKNSRFDFLLQAVSRPDFYLEIKGCTLVKNEVALFPDAPTARGSRQVQQLTELVEQGAKAAVIFIVQRHDATQFRPHIIMDPVFSQTVLNAQKAGVEVLAYRCEVDKVSISLAEQIPVYLNDKV